MSKIPTRRKVRTLVVVALTLAILASLDQDAEAESDALLGGGPRGSGKRRTLGTPGESSETRRAKQPARTPPPRGVTPTPEATGQPIEADKSGAPIVEVWGPRHRPATPEEVAREQARKAKTKPSGTAPASPELEPRHGRTTPAGYNPAQARARAREVAAHLAKRGPKAYDVELLRSWQQLAGLHVDGAYGGSTRGALIHYGVPNPPRPFSAPYATLPYVPPDEGP